MSFLTRLPSIVLILFFGLPLAPVYPVGGSPSSETPIRITAVDLASAYEKDEKVADKEYTGRLLEVSGVVSTVSFREASNGNRYLIVSLHSLAEPPGKIPYIGNVTCFFKNPRKSVMAQFKKGRKVIIQGVCEGIEGFGVSLDDCTIVSHGKSLARYLRPSAAI